MKPKKTKPTPRSIDEIHLACTRIITAEHISEMSRIVSRKELPSALADFALDNYVGEIRKEDLKPLEVRLTKYFKSIL